MFCYALLLGLLSSWCTVLDTLNGVVSLNDVQRVHANVSN